MTERGAVVTGGGRGIGAATARALAEAGVTVLAVSRTAEQVDRVARELRDTGHAAQAAVCDVTDAGQVRKLAETAAERLGRVDIVVNNAGRAHSAPLHRTTLDEWNGLFAANATSAFLVTQAFLPAMLEAGWGRVVNVASVAGLRGARYVAAYTAAKHALVGLTRALAADVADKGVTVNAVCPGYVDTDMTRASVGRIARKTGMKEADALEWIRRQNPQGRLISAGEVAAAICALCMDGAMGINGQTIVIDGGASA